MKHILLQIFKKILVATAFITTYRFCHSDEGGIALAFCCHSDKVET
ncbi:hypothetical protein FSS13T_10650 [Flavobacterium saliperosum S13]|uniref:Uncharacterized protein n=1 Tax=Flavobacterium saliperosum S13 TaxID=1341155 RepID=A0ABN0QIH4_9FLAO|nr:hypothetical protein FSS13T_10650 [Flavobacterium saliperosum S13]